MTRPTTRSVRTGGIAATALGAGATTWGGVAIIGATSGAAGGFAGNLTKQLEGNHPEREREGKGDIPI